MHDNDESPIEAAERIVDVAARREREALAKHLAQIPELFAGITELIPGLIKALEPLKKLAEDINRHEAETISFMDDQMPF